MRWAKVPQNIMMRMVKTFIGTGRKRYVENLYSVNTVFRLSALSILTLLHCNYGINKHNILTEVKTKLRLRTNYMLNLKLTQAGLSSPHSHFDAHILLTLKNFQFEDEGGIITPSRFHSEFAK